MKKILFLMLLATALFTSCKKSPDAGKLKYEVIITGSGYSNVNIEYTNEFGNLNTISNNTSANWTKTIDGTEDDCYYFYVSGQPTGSFDVTIRMYWEGELVDETTETTYSSGGTFNFFSVNANYCIDDIQ